MSIQLQIISTVLLQLVFFTFYYKAAFFIAKIIGRRVCPVCFSVGSTWLTLIMANLSGIIDVNNYLIALLLSQSVVGVSYLIDEFILVHNVKVSDYILKFGIIIYGTLAVSIFAFIHPVVGFLMFLPIILFGFYALTPNNYGR
ncbi:hypothetical protein A2415_03410 [candidate division WWE3 bacterium RIFOXYC1_FULL_39_7]|uniref:Uncharacterized protein n=2 Tax=Katanobacteria TaxID=422282 RepID=A0A1F4X9H7_UNCKA|nr:MAG: hypothetical protein A2415_03410 [candidate division WWE3 bacterium RIFOXYC1_FULL_39_7]OGC78355.1 MAG: hypothetical protein A2619_04995 [candidate division WWE3 bacterium RIFOXYD1_FULL_39_9]